ncbi:MAG: DUF4124 domain-containing protein [Myxococcaceae bacterium]|nr:DUF4124 domain-containing protein [Myxococcaceae bacterium]
MRSALLIPVLLASTALAQSEAGGVWTGYVGGWKPDRTGLTVSQPVRRVPDWTHNVPAWQWWQMASIQQQWALQTELQRRQAQETADAQRARQAWEAAEEERRQAAVRAELEHTRRAQLEEERRLATEREVALQRQLEAERRLAAEKELLAMQRLETERAALRAAAPAPKPSEPERPATPGNDVYRWVDSEGVVHYSTRVPDSAKPFATKVGGSR